MGRGEAGRHTHTLPAVAAASSAGWLVHITLENLAMFLHWNSGTCSFIQ